MRLFQSIPKLPRASGSQPGPVTPASWNRMVDAVERLAKQVASISPAESADLGVRMRDGVFSFFLKRRVTGGGGAADMVGAFYGMITGTDGHTYLQGGSVTGGTGVHTAANIKVIDSGTGPTRAAGTHMYVIATGDGITADGVLLPGWNLTNATNPVTIGYSTTVPDNTLPTAASWTEKLCHIDLGVFTADRFLPAAAGNIQISHCLGSYSVSRET